MIKGKTNSGIKFELDERIKDDARVLYMLVQIQSDKVTAERKGVLVFDMLNLIFGSDEGVMTFMDEVAQKNDGICSTEVLLKELNEIFDALGAKNS